MSTTLVPELDLTVVPLTPTAEQTELGTVVRSFLEQHSPEETVRSHMETTEGIDRETWKGLAAELGVCGLHAPERLGGAGAGFTEAAVVAEELGRALACVPYLSTVVMAQSLLMGLDDEGGHELLAETSPGRTTATVAFAEPGAAWTPEGVGMLAQRRGETWRLNGTKSYVVDGHTADAILVVARAGGGLSVFVVDGDAHGLSRIALPTMDLTRKQARLDFDNVEARAIGPLGGAEAAFSRMLDLTAVAVAAESVGGAERVLESAVEYAGVRVQFGRPIGSFQAVKHMCADMLIDVESARSAANHARAVADLGSADDLAVAASLAKAFCGEAYVRCAAAHIQVHGGIGFTWEHAAHLYFKRATANSLMFGDAATHRGRIGERLGI